MSSNTRLQSARVLEWDDSLGYGWLDTAGGRLFVHRRNFKAWGRRPRKGDVVQYVAGLDRHQRKCALEAILAGGRRRESKYPLLVLPVLLVVPCLAAWVYGLLAPAWLAYWVGINAVTWHGFAADKRKARTGQWRIPERSLHFLELAGGWPAAFLASRLLRHKSSKTTFRTVSWGIILAYHLAAYDALHSWAWTREIWRVGVG